MLTEDFVIEVARETLDPWLISLAASAAKSGKQFDGSKALVQKANTAISQAVVDALAHVAIVRKNNPDKSWQEILSRSDVQEALTVPFQEAHTTIASAISDAWSDGQSAGWKAAQAELVALGLDGGAQPPLSDATLSQILTDASENVPLAKDKLTVAIVSGDAAAPQKVGKDLITRAALGVSTASQFGYNESKEAAYASHTGLGKTWVAHFSPTTCKYCRWLHGQTVPIGEPFPLPPGGPVPYTGLLMGPQYHPNCRCSLLPHLEGKTQPEKLQAGALVDGADKDTPPPPEISSDALKAIPQSKLGKVLQWLIQWLGGSS